MRRAIRRDASPSARQPMTRSGPMPGPDRGHLPPPLQRGGLPRLRRAAEGDLGARLLGRGPLSILKISQKVGGIAAGAFAPDGRMLGFVFGLTGVRDGRLFHWSHMLAVDPEARDLGLGTRLKLYQRELLLPSGVEGVRVDLRSAGGAQRPPQPQPPGRRARGVRARTCTRARWGASWPGASAPTASSSPGGSPATGCARGWPRGRRTRGGPPPLPGRARRQPRSGGAAARRAAGAGRDPGQHPGPQGGGPGAARLAPRPGGRFEHYLAAAIGSRPSTATASALLLRTGADMMQIREHRPARDPADAEGAVPDLLRHAEPPPDPARPAARRRRRRGLERVRGRRAAQLQPGDHRHRLAGDARVGGAAGARPRLRRPGGDLPRPRPQLPRPPHGQGGGGDGRLGARGAHRGGLARPHARRHARPHRGRHLARHPEEPGGAGGEGPRGAWSAATARSRSRSSRAPDVEYLRAVREALGPDAPLMADANNAYTLDDLEQPAAARRPRADDDRAAARLGRPPAARGAAEAAARPRSAWTSRSPAWTGRRT